ncbi:MAG: putative MPP superfamily phosphohydrolase [Crocinitomix sp.]|jgi:predicted MPP superfamily phosphohydrolase
MHGRLRILPFIILGLIVLLEVYAYFGFKSTVQAYSPGLGNTVYGIYFFFMALSVISLLIIFSTGNRLSKSFRNFLFAGVFINLFSLLTFDIFALLDDVRRLGFAVFQANDLTRSSMLISIGLVIAAIPNVLLLLGMFIGPYRYRVKETTIHLPNLPTSFEGLKIVQISDIHSGSFYNKKAVNKGVDMVLDQKPDVVFFTGDLVNDDATEMSPYKEIFSRIKAPLGVFSILGNHDYGDYVQWPSEAAKAQNLEDLKAVHGDLGWRLLLNEHLYLEKNKEQIGLIGVENWGVGFHKVGDLPKAYEGCQAPVKLLLSHDPTHWDEEVTKAYQDIDVTFSGHTHGAQMGFEIGKYKWSPITLRYKKWAGLYQLKNQYMYINRGFGFLGYPGRLGIWPEVSVIRLTAKR